MAINLIDILILVSLAQGLLFAILLLFSPFFRGNHNAFLAASILMLVIIGLEDWLAERDFDDVYYLVDLGDDIPWVLLFYVPLFYYFLQNSGHPWRNWPYWWLLCLPFIVFLGFNAHINLSVDFDLYEIPNRLAYMQTVYDWELAVSVVFNLGLWIAAAGLVYRQKVEIAQQKWLRRLWLVTGILIICWGAIVFGDLALESEPSQWVDYWLWMGISAFIFWLIYRGIYKFQLAQDQQHLQALLSRSQAVPLEPDVPQSGENPGTPIITDAHKAYYEQLRQLMQQDHLYREQDLSRDRVAERLGISPGYLSQIISQQGEQNFSSFVNAYRVEAVKRMLADPQFDKYSLLAIGMEAGFKSKTAFYTTFKKATGLTPKT
ncbi:MAG: helix-turn-helix domain-containing protein, partial [Bacteroidota bacterium]